jgi:hypothetical protein
MTIAELIEELTKYPIDASVRIILDDVRYHVDAVKPRKIESVLKGIRADLVITEIPEVDLIAEV